MQDRLGGEDVLWPAVQEADLPYSLRHVRRILLQLSQEEVNYTDLQQAADELPEDCELYDFMRKRDRQYTRRQVEV